MSRSIWSWHEICPISRRQKYHNMFDNELLNSCMGFCANAWNEGFFITFSATFVASWWRHQMETISALLAICAGISPVTGEFTAQRPVTRSFDVFFDLYLNKRLSKQSWGWWFETLSRPLWRHCNGFCGVRVIQWCSEGVNEIIRFIFVLECGPIHSAEIFRWFDIYCIPLLPYSTWWDFCSL